jgi:hypothetical protein
MPLDPTPWHAPDPVTTRSARKLLWGDYLDPREGYDQDPAAYATSQGADT